MWRSATSSERPGGRRGAGRSLALASLLVACWLPAAPAAARVFLTVDEALKLAFPGSSIERRTAYLTEGELERARRLAGVEIQSALVHPYVATRDGRSVGTAYFDTHRVRTLAETLMVVVDPAGRVARVEVLAFHEPEDYLPPRRWYGQFLGEDLGDGLALERDIRGVTGASLTARATTDSVRRVLALDRVLEERGER